MPIGAFCALFVHAHLDDHDSPHHQGHAIHAHFQNHDATPVHHDDGLGIEQDESERTLSLPVFVAVSPDVHIAPALPVALFTIVASPEPAPREMRRVTHGHDPPLFTRLAARPPPATSA